MKIHLVAICGSGMGSFAGLLAEAGHEVRGSDKAFYPPMSERLQAWDIPTMVGFAAEHLDWAPDLVVVGNACSKDNVEAVAARAAGLRMMSFPQALAEFFLSSRRSVVVAGTHGKTTTSSLLSFLLVEAGQDPSYLIGGIPANYGKSFRLGKGDIFVVEGDEYDSAFFDKRPKFVHYQPEIAVLSSVEFDHADIYADMDAYRAAFRSFLRQIPPTGLLVACDDLPEVRDLIPQARCRVIAYGLGAGAGFRARQHTEGPQGASFVLEIDGSPQGTISIPLSGRHNVQNALAALAVAAHLGLRPDQAATQLPRFAGVARRMQVRGQRASVTVIDDFAHHPTAVAETVRAARQKYPDAFLVAVFEPRTNTSRRKFFQERYPSSFAGADRVLVVPPYGGAGLTEAERFDSEALAASLRAGGQPADCLADAGAVVADLVAKVPAGAVILVMSNGAFDHIHEQLLTALALREEGKP